MADTKNQKPDYERMLRKAGVRITRPRRVIVEILSASDDHPDALEIFRRASEIDPSLSLSTVYRTMKLLEGWAPSTATPSRAGRRVSSRPASITTT